MKIQITIQMSFVNKIESRFDFMYDKYKNNITMINDLIEFKKSIIDDYDIVKLDKSEEIAIANAIESRFDFMYDKYKNNITIIDDLIELKKSIIDDYDIVKLDKSKKIIAIINAIKVKHFIISDNGIILSVC